ncbi:MAG: hypothetical protein H6747_14675 [Deltaproteobacteria bacterium]|nr:hypothetical protein [Deltaproteobacteria bacterium]
MRGARTGSRTLDAGLLALIGLAVGAAVGCADQVGCSNPAFPTLHVTVQAEGLEMPICGASVRVFYGETFEDVACAPATDGVCADSGCPWIWAGSGELAIAVSAPGYATVTTGVHIPERTVEVDCDERTWKTVGLNELAPGAGP